MTRLSALSYSVAAVLLCYGFILFLFGPCLTAMSETFAVPLTHMGLLFTVFSFGLIPSVLLVGYLSELVGKRRILLASLLIMAAACALFGAVPSVGARPSFLLALALTALMGVGGGGIEALTNALIADDNQPAPGFALNFAHAFFAIGAVLGPIVAGLLLSAGLPWQHAFFGGAGMLAAMFLLLLFQRPPAAHRDSFRPGAALGLLRSRLLWLLLIVLGMYVGAEVGLTAWVSPLMEQVLGSSRGTAVLPVSVFWLFMIAGRLATSIASTRFRPAPLVLALSVGSAVAALALARSPNIAFCLASSAAVGLFMSGVFGLVMTDAARHFPHHSGPVFGFMTAGVGAGALLVPALMGWVASFCGLRFAMLIPSVLMAAVAGSYLLVWRR